MKINEFFPSTLFEGKTVFVTGGSSGINLGVASHFASLGANVTICARTAAKLEAAGEQLRCLSPAGSKILTIVADVRDAAAMAAALAQSEAQFGPLDVMIAGAAGNFLCPAEDLSSNGFKTVVDIDLLGAFHAARLSFEQLKASRGSIVFISAPQSASPYAFQLHVGAAKAGIDNMMKNLALEWGRYGIRSNSIVPGPIGGTEGMRRLSNEDADREYQAAIPLQRYGELDDIGNAAVFLCSPMAAHITGVALPVDGGYGLIGSTLWNRNVEATRGARPPGRSN
jgi:NAD(P)-dependent dehydrogenase (short-subunit alcohol dehydrogenase family)